MKKHSIAIDGPAGAGKSSVAKGLARELGFLYVDTGAIYRTVGLYAIRQGADPEDGAAVDALLQSARVEMVRGAEGEQRMLLNGEDVTEAIREQQVSDYASKVAALPQVRAFLLDMQRNLALEHDVIMDGRDIGTVVLPGADLKVFLTASPEARAERRCAELRARGEDVRYEAVLRDVIERDERDANRETAPLRQAHDAVLVDTTALSLEEAVGTIRALVRSAIYEK